MSAIRSTAVWVFAAMIVLGSAAVAGGQGHNSSTPVQPSAQPMGPPDSADGAMLDGTARIEANQAKLRNDERQKKLVADTATLLQLATELQKEVDKSTKDTLSLDVIKKADEIEKLAHSVKEKMKGT